MPYIGNPIYQSAFVTDQFSGTGSQTAYTMSVAPAGTTNVLVVVSGVVQDPSTYGVVGNTLTFSTAPPSGTGNISCRYLGVPVTGVTTTAYRTVTEFTATAGQTTFTPPSYNVGFINVYLNGVLLGSADYTATNGTTVVLATGASAGNLVTVESFRIESVANAIPNAAGAVSSSNIVSGVNLTNPTVTGTLGVSGTLTSGSGSANYLTINGNSTGQPAYINLAGSDTNVGLDFNTKGTGAFRVNVNSTTVSTTNAYGIGLGSAVPSSGIGIAFPATQVDSANPNTLDDYEEGSWTPVDGSGAGLSLSVTSASYIKIGKLVFINTYLTYPSNSNGTIASIGGLPYTAGSGNQYSYIMGRVQYNLGNMLVWQANAGATSMSANLGWNSAAGGPTNANLSSSFMLMSGCYIATS